MFRFLVLFLFLSTSCFANAPLSDKEFEGVLRKFKVPCAQPNDNFSLPEAVKLKAPLAFSVKEIQSTTQDKRVVKRQTEITIQAPRGILEADLTQRNGKALKEVGRIVLQENNWDPGIDGKFSLHFIGIHEPYQSKGFGGTALDLTIALAQELSKLSPFYARLSLQCCEYDGEIFLGNSPYRLTYYLNHGFHIDPKTLRYMRHMELSSFVRSLSVKKLVKFLNYYDESNKKRSKEENNIDIHNYPLNSYVPHADLILGRLQELYSKANALSDDEILQIAESNSPLAAKCALNRIYYDPSVPSEENAVSGLYMYLLHLDVNNWSEALKQRCALLESRKKVETHKFNPNELNDLLDNVYRIYWQFIGNLFTGTEKVASNLSSDDNQATKMRKVGSSEDSTITNSPNLALEGTFN